MAHLTPAAEAPLKFLFTGDFLDRWTEDALRILSMFARDPVHRPLVLLPHDIQVEDYEHVGRVRCGHDASRALEQLVTGNGSRESDLVLIDLAPDPCPEIDPLVPVLNAHLRGDWPRGLTLLVLSPTTEGLHVDGFDARLRLPS
ncbi:hypothetical protein [Leucobacter triazinivorans]|uniref:Uncharacterized protein n=1 Tax=Leucobacter triazinivorans TaxID=1784719 RepID=A0A4P6KHQ6_9MICO|nr:hypothetical protein [Leucobacter triazinivorans]QBE49902.1 hypothetical protein EVS81_14580 [Leucobacter triazinivorans]